MKKIGLSVVIAFGFLLFSGCASIPPMDFSVQNVNVSQHKINAEVKSITVAVASKDEIVGEVPMGMEIVVPQLWQTALTDALNKMAIFQDDATKKVNISVKITRLEIPTFGTSVTTESGAKYEITDRKTNEIIFSQYISAPGFVPFNYNSLGVIRGRESINRAVKDNIKQFLESLRNVNIK